MIMITMTMMMMIKKSAKIYNKQENSDEYNKNIAIVIYKQENSDHNNIQQNSDGDNQKENKYEVEDENGIKMGIRLETRTNMREVEIVDDKGMR